MCAGGEKSGWPMPRLITGAPRALSASARSSTANAPSSSIAVMLGFKWSMDVAASVITQDGDKTPFWRTQPRSMKLAHAGPLVIASAEVWLFQRGIRLPATLDERGL